MGGTTRGGVGVAGGQLMEERGVRQTRESVGEDTAVVRECW